MNDRLRLKVAIMAICFVSLISKGIVLERLTHKNDLLDVYPSFNIQNVDIKKTELEESLKMIMDKAALSKYFKNFSIQFVKTNYCKEPIIIVIDLRSIFENKEKPIGLYCSDHQQYFFIKEDSNRLWEKYFSYSGSEESVELRQIIVPDSVYIMEPDVSFVCVAKIEGNLCKILYCEIDGKIDEADEAAEEAEPATFSFPSVGGVIDEPIELEPAYTTLMTRDYCGNYIYCNGTLERILMENGYIQGGDYYFYIKDYQGNIRVILNQSNQPIELNSYYPYGGLMAATTTEGTQPYKYGTKELDRENGLDLYDSKARMYDPTIGRTPTQNPMAEKYYSMSPYLWCAANPITFTDPNGEDLIINGSCILKQIYLEMLHNSTGNIYAFDDKNKLMLKGKDFDFNGESSQTLSALVSSAINSERVYSFSLTGEKGDDKSVFIDSYETKQLDISDLKKIGKTSIALQGALIGHQINEIMVGGDYPTAHNESLKKEGVIYGELVGDCSISSRIQFPNMSDRPFDNIFEYNANHSFLLKSGGCIITKKIGDIRTITTVNSNGELKKVKKL
mgnify:CR=1 FL=1